MHAWYFYVDLILSSNYPREEQRQFIAGNKNKLGFLPLQVSKQGIY